MGDNNPGFEVGNFTPEYAIFLWIVTGLKSETRICEDFVDCDGFDFEFFVTIVH